MTRPVSGEARRDPRDRACCRSRAARRWPWAMRSVRATEPRAVIIDLVPESHLALLVRVEVSRAW